MVDKKSLMREIDLLPSKYVEEVYEFIRILKQENEIPETMLLSEQALAKEWSTAEEDIAWANL